MKIQIFNAEIKAAVKCYLAKEGINVDNYNLDMAVIAGRSGADNRIEIELNPRGSEQVIDDIEDVVEPTNEEELPAFGSTVVSE